MDPRPVVIEIVNASSAWSEGALARQIAAATAAIAGKTASLPERGLSSPDLSFVPHLFTICCIKIRVDSPLKPAHLLQEGGTRKANLPPFGRKMRFRQSYLTSLPSKRSGKIWATFPNAR
jgi:hypothetical protein